MLHVEPLVFNPFQENTYLLYDPLSHECAIVDPGMVSPEEEQRLVARIESLELKPVLLLQTHLHLDHVFGTGFVAKRWGLIPQAHQADAFLIDQTINLAAQFGMTLEENPPAPETFLNEDDEVLLGSFRLKVIHVPGHSPGGIVFYCEQEKVLLSGDVLFKDSIGRTDLPGGVHDLLIDGIKTKLMGLPDEVVVYPGHGPSTTIGAERWSNPYL
jgi:glyoxylase-like metal-dependent hydrolase (beta-lactamase superfamily II)